MTPVEFSEGNVSIDGAVLARAFGISDDDLKQRMREGTITSRFERGEGEDAGTVRLVFFSRARRIRITADEGGSILTCGAVDFAGPPGFGSRLSAPTPVSGQDPEQAAHVEMLLDLALEGTFPASDPVAITIDAPRRTSRGDVP